MNGIDANKYVLFQKESNHIERIYSVRNVEIQALAEFCSADTPLVSGLIEYVSVCQPNAILRATPDVHGVRVGDHIAPPSGPQIVNDLRKILADATSPLSNPYLIHQAYETLHPFTDGNGRSGRALWLWMMERRGGAPLGFLHTWYYQSLANNQARQPGE